MGLCGQLCVMTEHRYFLMLIDVQMGRNNRPPYALDIAQTITEMKHHIFLMDIMVLEGFNSNWEIFITIYLISQ